MTLRSQIAWALFGTSLVAAAAHAEIAYTVSNIAQVTAGFPALTVKDVNDQGMVVGWTRDTGSHGTISQNGTIFHPSAGTGPNKLNWIYGVNHNGAIAGALIFNNDPNAQLQTPAVVIGGVQKTIGSGQGAAFDLNNAGLVVGTGGGFGALWTWNNATSAINTIIAGDGLGISAKINAKGQVYANFGASYFFDPDAGLKQLPLAVQYPAGLNDAGDLIGNTSTSVNNSAGTLITHDGQTISFSALLQGRNCFLGGISNDGVVAGAVKPNASDAGGGFVWDKVRGFRMLDTLIPQSDFSQDHVLEVIGGTEDGSILAILSSTNPFIGIHYAVLTPTPTPGTTSLLMTIGVIGLDRRRRAK